MEKKFDTSAIPLGQLLDRSGDGQLQLPDFQRGWVWDDNHILSLLASISMSYPIGAVMTLEAGNPDVRFKTRLIEGVDGEPTDEPDLLLLDGQQRTTSLYLALESGQPVPTQDSRGRELERWYYADIAKCIDPFVDREDAILSVPADRKVTQFGRDIVLDVSTRELEIENGMFPLSIVLDSSETMDWQLAYLASDEDGDRLDTWKKFNEAVVKPFVEYQVPAIQLAKSTPKEAVCQVFEKVNTGGVSLTVFELLTATYAADNFQLRDDWDARAKVFKEQQLLKRFQATDFLQVVSLLATYDRRSKYIERAEGDVDSTPAVSCKRKDVLRLELSDYEKWAETAQAAVLKVIPFLHGEKLFQARDLPYSTQLIPLSAAVALLGDAGESYSAREKLRRWFWCGVFGEMYGGSTETRFANDIQDLVSWIEDGGDEPRTIKEAQFQADRLLTLRTRNSAAYKGIHAQLMKNGCRDFRTGDPIDLNVYFEENVDIHHLFPKKWCADNGIDDNIVNCIVNKTAVDAKTNRKMGGDAPSKYVGRLESKDEIESGELNDVLRSHAIDPVVFRQDDFPSFFNDRFEQLLKLISDAMGKPVNRAANKDESPFVDPDRQEEIVAESIEGLLQQDESEVLEFKSSARFNLRTGQTDKQIEFGIVKTVAAFANAAGGTLLIGVNNDGEVVGIEHDYPFMKHENRDGFSLWLTNHLSSQVGKTLTTDVGLAYAELEGGTVCRVDVPAASSPVFVKAPGSPEPDDFYVRVNNSSEPFTGQAMLDYKSKRWP